MNAPGKNLELAASDLSRGLLHYGSILGRSSRALVPDLDGHGGRRQEHVQRVRTGEDRRFRTGPGDEAQRFAPLFQGAAAVTAPPGPPFGALTPQSRETSSLFCYGFRVWGQDLGEKQLARPT